MTNVYFWFARAEGRLAYVVMVIRLFDPVQ
jgi:hypothetical protein